MEANGMTFSDLAALEKVGNRHRGVANSALGLGIAGLAVGLVGLWGVNAASQARSRAAENAINSTQLALQQAINNGNETNRILANLIGTERTSRETWQMRNQPGISQYVDVQTNPNLSAQLMDYVVSRSESNAQAIAQANSGINSAVSNDAALKVHLYQPPIPCQCNQCNG